MELRTTGDNGRPSSHHSSSASSIVSRRPRCIRRIYVNAKTHSVDREERISATKELTNLEPANPTPWEALAWDALKTDRLEDARTYMARARELVAKKLSSNPPSTEEGRESLKRRETALSTIDRVYEFAKANQTKYGIMANVNDAGDLEFFWLDKSTGRPIARVNPDKPEEMLPLPQRKTVVIDKQYDRIISGGAPSPVSRHSIHG